MIDLFLDGFRVGYAMAREDKPPTIDKLGYAMGFNAGEKVKALQIFLKYRGLESAREDLRKRGINIEDLEITAEREAVNERKRDHLRDVFHSSANYNIIERVHLEEFALAPEKVAEWEEKRPPFNKKNFIFYDLLELRVQGKRPGFLGTSTFDVRIRNSAKDFANVIGERLVFLEKLENYFHQRMEAQQPQYNYTYRSRTEIK